MISSVKFTAASLESERVRTRATSSARSLVLPASSLSSRSLANVFSFSARSCRLRLLLRCCGPDSSHTSAHNCEIPLHTSPSWARVFTSWAMSWVAMRPMREGARALRISATLASSASLSEILALSSSISFPSDFAVPCSFVTSASRCFTSPWLPSASP
eukprot:748972-Hanusia_phi.AAC.1